MERQDYFAEVLFNSCESEQVLQRLKDLTADEANAIKAALEHEYGPRGLATIHLTSETELLKDPASYLLLSRAARQVEEFIQTTSRNYLDQDGFYCLALAATEHVEESRRIREKAQESRVFEVFDEDEQQTVVFDASGAETWGPEVYENDWNGDYWNYSIEETLYRHSSGHWTLVSESTHCEAPASCGKRARRIDEKEAVTWLGRWHHTLPSNLATAYSELVFAPGPAAQAQSKSLERIVPGWNKARGELTYDGKVIRRVQAGRAKNIVKVLDAFQEDGWPDRIDDPLSPSKDQQRLHETIASLNENMALPLVHFRADGTGQGIVWEATYQEPPRDGNRIPF